MEENRLNEKKSFNQFKLIAEPDVEFFDPPMCCPTGMCGPTIDQTLLDVSEMIVKLQSGGYQVERYQMSSHPNSFINNVEVMKLIREKQLAALPIVVVRGKIVAIGNYPKLLEIQEYLNEGK